MPHKFISLFLFLLMTSAASAQEPQLADYQATPHWIAPRSVPMVLLVMSKDQKMFRHAYSPGEHDGKEGLDIGFNPETKYLGYHDSESCYVYNNGAGYFERVGAAKKLENYSPPATLDAYIRKNAPENSYGVCDGSKGQWHGNWLNFVMTSRIDAIKKVLYGGTRSTDTENATVLEHSFIPRNALVWGYDVMADDEWSNRTGHLPYYNPDFYIGVGKPQNGRMHFFARYTDGYSDESLTRPPLLRVVQNIPAASKNRDGTAFRVWNWTVLGGEALVPPDNSFGIAGLNINNYTRNSYNARVRVCEALDGAEPPAGEACTQYPKNGGYKPTGLLQKYGEKDRMFFGLMTGVSYKNYTRRGGAIRHHIDSMSLAINEETGQIAADRADTGAKNIIRTIDKLTVTSWTRRDGRGEFYARNDAAEWTSFGNPMGEMLFEAVRYFGGLAARNNNDLKNATGGFYTAAEGDRKEIYPRGERPLPIIQNWAQARREDLAANCSKPVILMISDIDNTFDGDDIGGISSLPLLPDIKDKAKFPDFSKNAMAGYLDRITDHEGYNSAGTLYYYAKDPANPGAMAVCSPRKVDSLSEVVGLCPNEPSLSGSYSMAAVAHYAHTHDFSPDRSNQPLDIYAVGVSPALPPLDFRLPGGQHINLMPSAIMDRSRQYLLSFIGYAVENWDMDDNGTPYKVRINVNYPDESEVMTGWSDYEQDSTSIYEINLVTDAATPIVGPGCGPVCREEDPIVIHSGELRGYDPPALGAPYGDPTAGADAGKYYRFARQSGGGPMDVTGYVRGLTVTTMILSISTSAEISLGYTITGTDVASDGDNYDGTYIDVAANNGHGANGCYPADGAIEDWTVNGTPQFSSCPEGAWPRGVNGYYDKLLTPMGCEKPGSAAPSPLNAAWCNRPEARYAEAEHRMRILQTRSFLFAPQAPDVKNLPIPMELAAKYGGFSDPNGTGLPGNPATWAAIQSYNDDGTPNYGEPGAEIPKNYFYVANLASLSEKLGAAFETIAGSVSTGTANSAAINEVMGGGMTVKTQYHSSYPVSPGSSLSVKWLGNVYSLFLDAWGNQREDTDGKPGDAERFLDPKADQVIFLENDPNSGEAQIWRYPDISGRGSRPSRDEWVPLASAEDINDVWNVTRWLMEQNDVLTPRDYRSPAKGANAGRRVYSYFPATDAAQSLAGAAPWSPVALSGYLFQPANAANTRLQELLRCSTGNGNARENCAQKLISYTLGEDQPDFRPRSVETRWFPQAPRVWRMGDVMNSSPVIVGEASGNFHFLYGDKSYSDFKTRVAGRRNMVYFGSNDGILHAVNAGFYGSLRLGQAAYFTRPVAGDRAGQAAIPDHDLGAEVWGFIPQSLLPHLEWPTKADFDHSYMLDLTPTIVDMRIGQKNDPYSGWRTVLIGGLRLGGRSINIAPAGEEPEYIHSEFFALDITEPDVEPVLLWSYSTSELGQTITRPMVVRSGGEFYVVLPSGPTMNVTENGVFTPGGREAYDGRSRQNARVIILNAVNGQRVDAGQLVVTEENSFFNNTFMPVAMPGNIIKTPAVGARPLEVTWSNHVVYMGLSAETDARQTGALYRLQMVSTETGAPLPPTEWKLAPMFRPNRPITGAVNATYDALGNLWVLFGSGRLWSKDDAYPCGPEPVPAPDCAAAYTQYFYGLKEELVKNHANPAMNGTLAFTEIDPAKVMDVSGYAVYSNGDVCDVSALPEGETECTPASVKNYAALAASLKTDTYQGYQRALNIREMLGDLFNANTFEMIDTQVQLDARANGVSNAVVTVYVPSGDTCAPEGESYLFVLDTFTGLAAPYMKGYDLLQLESGMGADGQPVTQITGVTSSGSGKATAASIQHIGGLTLYKNTGQGGADAGMTLEDGGGSKTVSWNEVVEMGLPIDPTDYFRDLLKSQALPATE